MEVLVQDPTLPGDPSVVTREMLLTPESNRQTPEHAQSKDPRLFVTDEDEMMDTSDDETSQNVEQDVSCQNETLSVGDEIPKPPAGSNDLEGDSATAMDTNLARHEQAGAGAGQDDDSAAIAKTLGSSILGKPGPKTGRLAPVLSDAQRKAMVAAQKRVIAQRFAEKGMISHDMANAAPTTSAIVVPRNPTTKANVPSIFDDGDDDDNHDDYDDNEEQSDQDMAQDDVDECEGSVPEQGTEASKKRGQSRKTKVWKKAQKTKAGVAKKISKKQKVTASTGRGKYQKRRPFGALEQTVQGMMGTDVFADARQAEMARDMPTHEGGPNRAVTLNKMLDSLDEKARRDANRDRKCIDVACVAFRGGIKPADDGRWRVKGLRSTLQNHQILGTGFMLKREHEYSEQKVDTAGGILGDAMGLGKTVMTLGLIVARQPRVRSEGQTTLIVVPASLLMQWYDEIGIHCETRGNSINSRGVGAYKIYRSTKDEKSSEPIKELEQYHILIASYEEVAKSYPLRDPPPELVNQNEREEWWDDHYEKHKGILHRINFFRVVLDEAHTIRNPDSKKSRACSALKAKNYWCLTGTPCVNGAPDLWSMLSLIKMPMDMSYGEFKSAFGNKADDDEERKLTEFSSKAMLRRTHADKIYDARIVTLPTAHKRVLKVHLDEVEREMYNIVERRFRQRVNAMAADGSITSSCQSIWVMVLRLRQLTAHPLILQTTFVDYLEREDCEKLGELDKLVKTRGGSGAKLIEQIRALLARRREIDDDHDTRPVIVAPTQSELDDTPVDSTATGGEHGIVNRFSKYLRTLERDCAYNRIKEIKDCVYCHNIATDPQLTSCEHTYCGGCLEEAQMDAADAGQDGAACKYCGERFTASAPIGDLLDARTEKVSTMPLRNRGKKKNFQNLGIDSEIMEDWMDKRGQVLASAKTIAIKAQILEWLKTDPSAKIIIYTQWLPMVRVLLSICKQEHWGALPYTGADSHKKRSETILTFKTSPNIQILIASLKCGGLGLNLTMASRVICVDPWWNNATEQQAFCRVFRIGQNKETSMLHLVATNTIDERMEFVKERKQIRIDAVVDDNEIRKRLSLRDMLGLFGKVKSNEEGTLFVAPDDATSTADDE